MELDDIIDLLPPLCIRQCSGGGQVKPVVAFWQCKLELKISRKDCIELLAPYGCWSREEMVKTPLYALRERVIWLAACDASERNNED